ncbi:hypothetical protein CATMIT_01711, partial [Catenibacterium mitsuokai DSM 15897]
HAFERGVVELVDGGHAHALAERHLHRQADVADHAAGGDVVEGETDVAFDRAGQARAGLVGLRQRHDLVQNRLGLGFGEDAHSSLLPRSAELAGGVDDVDAVEPRRAGTVRNRRDLPRLALAVEERTAQAVVLVVADRRARVPELRRADLIGHVLEHAGDLAVLDLVEHLAAEL